MGGVFASNPSELAEVVEGVSNGSTVIGEYHQTHSQLIAFF
jgi:hypothetical protein